MAESVEKRNPLKRLGVELSIGAVLGFAGAILAGPSLIGWWYEPPSKDAFSCAGTVRTALSQFVKMELTCAGVGAAALMLIMFFARRAVQKP
jgi:hypothetical protein